MTTDTRRSCMIYSGVFGISSAVTLAIYWRHPGAAIFTLLALVPRSIAFGSVPALIASAVSASLLFATLGALAWRTKQQWWVLSFSVLVVLSGALGPFQSYWVAQDFRNHIYPAVLQQFINDSVKGSVE